MESNKRSTRPGRRAWSIGLGAAILALGGGTFALGGDRAAPLEPSCGLAAPDPALSDESLPDPADVPGSELVALDHKSGSISADVNVPLSVEELFDSLRSHIRGSAYDIVHRDFEGFEAELYIARNGQAGVFQILQSRCPDRSRLLIQLPSGEATSGPHYCFPTDRRSHQGGGMGCVEALRKDIPRHGEETVDGSSTSVALSRLWPGPACLLCVRHRYRIDPGPRRRSRPRLRYE